MTSCRILNLVLATHNRHISLFKRFPIAERLQIQFRAEYFNALNHANPAKPVANIRSSTVERILSAREPRILQFGLKLIY